MSADPYTRKPTVQDVRAALSYLRGSSLPVTTALRLEDSVACLQTVAAERSAGHKPGRSARKSRHDF
jgi:hypothetical protein